MYHLGRDSTSRHGGLVCTTEGICCQGIYRRDQKIKKLKFKLRHYPGAGGVDRGSEGC
jgi:hypothetical protein